MGRLGSVNMDQEINYKRLITNGCTSEFKENMTKPVVEVDISEVDIMGIQRYTEWTEHPDIDDIELMRLAVAGHNQRHVYNAVEKIIWDKKYKSDHLQIFLQYLYSVKNEFNPERCIHFMYEYWN